jgi:hypothetical protein
MHYKEERSGQKWLKDKNEVVKFLYRGVHFAVEML